MILYYISIISHDIAYWLCDIMWDRNAGWLYPPFYQLTRFSQWAQRRSGRQKGRWNNP